MAFPGKMKCLFPKTEKGHQPISEMIPFESSLGSQYVYWSHLQEPGGPLGNL